MPQPSNTLKRLAKRLFIDPPERDRFIDSLLNPTPQPVAVVWVHDELGTSHGESAFETLARPDWMPQYVDLVPFAQRPGQHLLHQQGACYCLDPSSVFMASGLRLVNSADTVLDVCASPGGKSVIAWRELAPSQLWCNEVIGKRIPPLISNLKRCRITPSAVISADPSVLAERAAGGVDVVLVDAPCSGQSLVARGKQSPGCFHPATINMNANRQRRILANAAATVAPSGWLLYMTCTYSLKENERNVEWFLKHHPTFRTVEVPELSDFRSHLTEHFCYRQWPYDAPGAGGFMTVMRCAESERKSRTGSLSSLPVRWNSDGRNSAVSSDA